MSIGGMYAFEAITPKRFLVPFAVHMSSVHSPRQPLLCFLSL